VAPRYGDRHGIWASELLTRWTYPRAGRTVQAGCGAQIWGQTRSYGDTYHSVLLVGTVASLSAVPVFFSGGVSRGAGDEVAADISQPGGAELSDQRAQAPRLWASGNFGSGSAGLGNMRARKSHRIERICATWALAGEIWFDIDWAEKLKGPISDS